MLFLNVWLFCFSKFFKWLLWRILWETILSYNRFQKFLWSSTTAQTFLFYKFLTMKQRLFKIFFKFCTEMCVVSLFFLCARNIATSLLMIHLKRTAGHYANLNSSSIMNKLFLSRGPSNILFCLFVFNFLFMVILTSFCQELSFFDTNFQNSFQDLLYYKILGCQTLRH